ncbi:hypothetical protein L798_15663 [Zootermopsis nevadensis]|uniref:Uncharacterized protein n=2 Tax=Zootermopsis nevadensis TaxID=136037 RepID=A0A067QK91_ZOONE|nr:hypothetical protein L798_15663 [Zootermopsis nevadensis]
MCSGEYESPSPSKRPRTSRGVAAWNEVIVLKPEGKAVLEFWKHQNLWEMPWFP